MKLANRCTECRRRIFATKGGQGVRTVAVGLAKYGKIAHAKCMAVARDERGFFGGGGSPSPPPPPPPPPPPDNTAAQEAAARARRALQRKRGRQQTILAGASAPLGLTTNPGGTTLG